MAEKTTDTTKPKYDEKIQSLSDRQYTQAKIDKTTGIGDTPTDLYYDTLPEGITRESSDLHEAHRETYVAASVLTAGRLTADAVKGNADLSRTTTSFGVGKSGNLTVSYDRTATFRDPRPGATEPIVKHGVASISFTEASTSNIGDLKKVRTHASELIAAAIKGS